MNTNDDIATATQDLVRAQACLAWVDRAAQAAEARREAARTGTHPAARLTALSDRRAG